MKELTQEEIIFENTEFDHLGGWWGSYKYGSIGNVMHWAYVFFGLDIADRAQYGMTNDVGEMHCWGKLVANFRLDEELKMPIFYNINDEYAHAAYKQNIYLSGLKNGLQNNFYEKHKHLKNEF